MGKISRLAASVIIFAGILGSQSRATLHLSKRIPIQAGTARDRVASHALLIKAIASDIHEGEPQSLDFFAKAQIRAECEGILEDIK